MGEADERAFDGSGAGRWDDWWIPWRGDGKQLGPGFETSSTSTGAAGRKRLVAIFLLIWSTVLKVLLF